METVREQLVKKPYKSTDKAMQFFILAMALFIALAVMILASSLLGGIFIIAGLLFAAIVLYGGYYLSGNLNVEYEYCIAGSETVNRQDNRPQKAQDPLHAQFKGSRGLLQRRKGAYGRDCCKRRRR